MNSFTLFENSKSEFERRWNDFKKGKAFVSWTPNRPHSEIEAEFKRIQEDRDLAWKSPEFSIAEGLIAQDCARVPDCVAFEYNKSCSYFNSSNVSIEGMRFLAMEGTRSKNVEGFFRLLETYDVQRLVRLTPSYDGEEKKCHPYWENRMDGDALTLPSRKIPYFICEEWTDRQGIDPKVLYALISSVRRDFKPEKDLTAVHCSAGVGRTGTFIAGFTLIHLAENKREISVEEVVRKLSLQRVKMVWHISQYATLYRLLDHYFTALS